MIALDRDGQDLAAAPGPGTRRPPVALSVLLIAGGVLGLIAAFALTLDKIAVLQHPGTQLSCNISPLIGCGKNLDSWEGRLFGFPNPLIGLVAFPAPIIVGVASLAGARFPRWFWAVFNLGMAFAIAFVVFLISASLFDYALHVICPWCACVWAAVIPMSLSTTLWNVRERNLPLGERASRVAGAAFGWAPLITLGAYLVFLVVAQTQLDLIGSLL